MGKRVGPKDGGPPPSAPKAPRRKGNRSGPASLDASWCQRCEEPVDIGQAKRGGTSAAPLIGCDACWATYERHYAEEAAWPDICERCTEQPEFNNDFGARAVADLELESQVAAAAEKGSVEIITFYGQEVSSSMVQLTPKQWASEIVPKRGSWRQSRNVRAAHVTRPVRLPARCSHYRGDCSRSISTLRPDQELHEDRGQDGNGEVAAAGI